MMRFSQEFLTNEGGFPLFNLPYKEYRWSTIMGGGSIGAVAELIES